MNTIERALYRGKDENGIWRYGSLIKYPDGVVIAENNETHNCLRQFKVIPSTVGQLVVLDDDPEYPIENRSSLFVGDILEDDKGIIWVVEYNPEYCAFMARRITIVYDDNFEKENFLYCLLDKSKLIGNIHDNPELKGGE